ncbi:UDP-N-acetylmuramoyl-L-alanine--D-glutamate ligase [Variovorax sp. RHLX14]|uniref:UDP-N-acetylmuramoyl-L-alanine--D-glutamate ligase n=1 Tax=Variovorax sp. RHLX14 TaxID=1259731 RepID=UPI003F46E65A
MKHLQNLPVLILGLGASGLAMARWCARHGAVVTVADTREAPPQLAALRLQVPDASFIGGPLSAALVEGTAVRAVYRSPGLSPASIASVVDAARATGLVVGGELDLFAQALADLRTVDVPAEEIVVVPEAEAEAEPVAGTPVQSEIEMPEPEPEPEPEPVIKPAAETAIETVPAKPSVHTAAREAAEFVARIAELSAAAPPAPAEDDKPLPIAAPEPAQPKGYTPAVLAITGTNGKTTVTALTGQLVERAGKSVAVAGNIGPTLLDTLAAHIDAGTLPDVWVLELSSFQLDGVQGFEPTAAAVLNISQDHLDWHGDMASYIAVKARIFGAKGLLVLNRDDAAVMQMLPPPVRARLQRPVVRAHITFGAGMPLRPGDFGIERINGMGWLVRALEADETLKRKRGAAAEAPEIHLQRLMPADALRIRGQHNALNALAALALATAAGCQLGPMLYGLREYRGEPHRVESIAIFDEVEYFDDSKGTNVGATVAALGGLGIERRLVVILGGEGKGQDFEPLAAPVRQYARAVVLIGRDAPLIEAALSSAGVPLLHAASMEEAVHVAATHAESGDAVLLSPACASFDMFKDYAHRAAVFCDAVQTLQGEHS